jgi:type I restriction enzyme S subunit
MVTNNLDNNEEGWISDKLPNVVEILMGQSPPSTSYNKNNQGLPFFQGNKDFGEKYPTVTTYTTNPIKISEKGDVLISVRAPIGDVNLSFEKSCIGRGLAALRTNGKVDNLFLYYFIQTMKNYLRGQGTGTTFSGVSKHNLETIEISYPKDIEIQKKIATSVEYLLAKNSTALSNIKNAKSLIKKFRQSVLTAAITGKLTAEWRETNPNVEPAIELLEKIKAERRKKSKSPIREIDESEFPTIPETWLYSFFGNIIDDFKYGTSEKSEYSFTGTPVLRIPNVISQKVNLEDLKYLQIQVTREEYLVKSGDILIVRSNGSRDLVGKNALVKELEGSYAFASYLIRIRPLMVLPAYVSILLNSPLVRQQLFSNSKSAAGINNINTQELATMIIPLPPLEEQIEIVKHIDYYNTIAEKVEMQIEKAEKKVSKLTQAILAKVFNNA